MHSKVKLKSGTQLHKRVHLEANLKKADAIDRTLMNLNHLTFGRTSKRKKYMSH